MYKMIDQIDMGVLTRFDDVIDVRSPSEFSKDHIDGAVNLPVLDDAERAQVGTIYVQESKFQARRIGAACIARNIAAHLEGPLRERPGGYAPVIYCWRGGQRSQAMATVLSQVGWRTTLIAGGYKTYRAMVGAWLYAGAAPAFRLVLLDGNTGTAKTEILGRLGVMGVQTLDLEAMAEHRGSLFGAVAGRPQPSQKLFESRLWAALARLDPARPVVVEAESSRIGERALPTALWKMMTAAPRIELHAPVAERARYLVRAYLADMVPIQGLDDMIASLPRHLSREQKAAWRDLAARGAFEPLATSLIEAHYDPAYARSRRADAGESLGAIGLDGLDAAAQQQAAERIAELAGA